MYLSFPHDIHNIVLVGYCYHFALDNFYIPIEPLTTGQF